MTVNLAKSQTEIVTNVYRRVGDGAFSQALVATGRQRTIRFLAAMMARAAADEIFNLDSDNRESRPAGAVYLAGNDDQDGAGVALAAAMAAEQEQAE